MRMLRVYKYPLTLERDFVISMPGGAELLCVKCYENEPALYALIDPHATLTLRTFCAVYTGSGVGDPIQHRLVAYVDTFRVLMDTYHLFELVS
jgi:hypothetical protein